MKPWGSSLPRRGIRVALAAALATSLAAGAARADDPQDEDPDAAADDPSDAEARAPAVLTPLPPPNRGLILPSERSPDLDAHWQKRRAYLRERDDRRADDEEQRVRQLKDDLGIENLFAVGSALVRESEEALAAGATPAALGRCKLAVELAPGLPAAHTCLARAFLADSFGNAPAAAREILLAVDASLEDPRLSRALLANALAVGLLGVLFAGAAFALLLFARYAPLYLHDVHHLFPDGARRWQTSLLGSAVVLLPLLLQAGPVALVIGFLLAAALYARRAEVVVSCLVLAVLAASPWIATGIGKVAAFGGPAADVWLLEHGEGSPPSLQRLQRRAEAGPDLPAAFALARKAKRDGDLVTAEALYRRALEARTSGNAALAAVHNNLGNVHLLQNDTARALKDYQRALELMEGLAAPHFNISRTLGLGGVETLEKVQAEQARALELDRARVERFTAGQLQANRKSNHFLMDVVLDEATLEPLLQAEEKMAAPIADEVRARLVGGLPGPLAALVPLLAAGAILALHIGRWNVRPSGQCDRCGREVCKRCDADARPTEALCAQCVNVFIRRAGVDAATRQRKEQAVDAWKRRRWTVARAAGVLSGAGHVILGYSVRGLIFLVLTGVLLASVVLWRGLAHEPVPVRSGVSFLRIAGTVACFLALYAVCVRDLIARHRVEGA